MNSFVKNTFSISLALALIACGSDNTNSDSDLSDLPVDQNFSFTYDFSEDDGIWTAGFADYPVGEEAFFELEAMPTTNYSLLDGSQRTGFKLSGSNRSDDLFMFIKTSVSELAQNHMYSVSISATIAVNYGPDCAGIGGSPGDSVYIKSGVSIQEPLAVAENDFYRMNIDIGNQSQPGETVQVIGNFVSEELGCDGADYALITVSNDEQPLEIITDDQGMVWVILGFDSGFEGTTTTYIQSYTIDLTQL